MTEDKLNRICAAGVLVFLALLIVMFAYDRKDRAARIEANRETAARIEAEAEQRGESVREIFASMTEAVGRGPAGFVCWGDAEMDGSNLGTLSASLDQKIEETYFAKIRAAFRREGLNDVSVPEIPVVNMGASHEGIHEIMVRTGARRMMTAESFVLPEGADKTSQVDLSLSDSGGNILHFAEQQHAVFGETTIDGVKGYLYTGSEYYDDLHARLAFRRSESGESYVVPAWTEVETGGGEDYIKYYPVLFFAEQDNVSATEFAGYMQEIMDRYGRQNRNVLICVTEEGSDWDLTLREAFGDHYLRQDKSAEEMTAEDYDALADRVFSAFEAQDAFWRVEKAVREAQEALEGLDGTGGM